MTVPDSTQSRLTITLFGPMQALVAGQPVAPLRSRKSLWLLALLSLRANQPVARAWLAAMLWPDLNPQRAAANFRTILSELRNALSGESGRLQTPNRLTVLLDLTGANVDLLTFDAAIRSRQLPALQRAVELYRGPLLEGWLEEWVFPERMKREQQCLQALHTLGEAAVAAGDHLTAIGFHRRAGAINPLLDSARRDLMDALAKSGDINAALQVYREFAELLRSELMAVPDKVTSDLYARLRAERRLNTGRHTSVAPDKTPEQVVRGYLTHSLTPLIGREEEKIEVAFHLRRSRLVTLTGVGGIGKTRLAILVAEWSKQEYADGVWIGALESISDSKLVIPQIASTLGVKEEPGRTLLQGLTAFLRARRLLLVLDNCEHLLDACAAAIEHLLRECAGLRILVTSREALGITGERVWAVPALPFPDPNHLPPPQASLLRVLAGYEAVQLFVERAQAVQKTFALNRNNGLAVAQVCAQLEGLPLAIELAAARLRALTVSDISTRLNNHLALLTGGNRAAATRQQTLRATLDWSYSLLSESERIMLRRLPVFAGGWTSEAAEQVCRGAGVAEGEMLDLLTSLVGKSLVVFEEREAAEGRYRLLEMVRQYAAEGLQASGEAEQIRTRHRDWFLALAEEAEPNLKGAEQANWLQRLEREHANLRAALAFSATDAQGVQASLRLAGALYRFWQLRGDFSEGRGYLRKALAREGAQEATVARAKALNGAGGLAFSQGDYTSARALYEQALMLQRELGNQAGIALSLIGLGNVAHSQGNQEAARTLYEESLAIRRELGDRWGIANSLSNLGSVAYSLRDYGVARELYEESLAMNQELGDKAGIANSLYNLGCSAHVQGDPSLAKSLLEESLAIRRAWGDKANIANLLYNLGNVAHTQGDYAAARALLQESLTLYREIGHPFIIHVLGLLGHVERAVRDYAQATSLYRESLKLRQETGDRLSLAQSLEDFAGLAGRQGQPESALRLLGAAETLVAALGRTLPVGYALDYERTVADARARCGEEAFAAAWEEGRTMTLEQAVAYACASNPLHCPIHYVFP